MEYRKGVRRKVMKPVTHIKRLTYVSNEQPTVRSGATTYWKSKGASHLHADLGGWPNTDLGKGALDYVMGKLPALTTGHYDRWKAVRPSMHDRANLTVCLLELGDVKRMWDILPKKHFNLRNWIDVLKHVNGLHLNYNFGWKPLANDVKSSLLAADRFEKRLDKLLREADKPLIKRFADRPASTTSNELITCWRDPPFRHRYELTMNVVNSSSFHYCYDLPKYSEKEMRWRAWADALGLHASMANLWEVIPWSFVVDWFVDIGGLLEESYPADWIQPWITWYQASYSQKATGNLRWSIEWTGYGGVIYKWPAVDLTFSIYRRGVGLPNFSAATDPLDADKIRLGASLLLSKLL